jgi:hypothetical protein
MALRRLMLAVLMLGLAGMGTELVMLEHYEDVKMRLPLGAIAATIAAGIYHAATGSARSVRVLQTMMSALVVLGGVGMVLHYRGSLEFQMDMDPTLSRWALFWKVLHMKAPPTLAPGALAQLGLVGLVTTYRHPALRRGGSITQGVSS